MIELAPYIKDVYPRKAQFLSGEAIQAEVEVCNPENQRHHLRLEVRIAVLDEVIEKVEQEISVPADGRSAATVRLAAKEGEFQGYGIDVFLYFGTSLLDVFSSSFDVVSDWRKSIRYGFLSDFDTDEQGKDDDVAWMSKMHLNAVQFYDWMYRHDELVPPRDGEFQDLMGRTLNLGVVREKIARCHARGMRAIAYGAVYAAGREFFRRHPDWALYDGDGNPLDFIGIFHIMSIDERSPWHWHIIGQFRNAIEKLDFDGIHMDTYGFPKTALSRFNGALQVERLEEHFPVLIDHTREQLEKSGKDIALIFNNVGNWPVAAVASAAQDAVYIEVWKPYEKYHHLQQLIAWAAHLGQGKPVILAAYLKPFQKAAPGSAEKANYAALLLTAVIVAHGGCHLLLGESGAVLTQGYYPDYSRLEPGFVRTIRNYYDFLVRYAAVFYDPRLRDVSMTHTGGDNLEYRFGNGRFSACGQSGRIWTVLREKPGRKTVQLINLCGNNDSWNKGKNAPPPQRDIEISVWVAEEVKRVFLASPDEEMGRPRKLAFRIESGDKGRRLVVTVPRLLVWCLIVIEMR